MIPITNIDIDIVLKCTVSYCMPSMLLEVALILFCPFVCLAVQGDVDPNARIMIHVLYQQNTFNQVYLI